MKTVNNLLLLSLILGVNIGFGQDYVFRVVVNQGKNEVRSDGNWTPITVGAELKSADELRIAENAYLGLIHINGKPLEMKESGRYTVANLSARVGTGSSSVLNKYTEFIITANKQKTNKLSATGAVHRGVEKIGVHLPSSAAYVFGDTVAISWDKEEAIPGPYVVTFTNIWGDVLHEIETAGNSIFVNLNDKALAKESDVIVEVRSTMVDKASDPFFLRKFSRGDSERVSADYDEISPAVSENTVLNRIIKAAFFEQKKLLVDAATAFRQAIELQPDFPALLQDYENFLLRNGLKAPTEK